MTCFLAKFGYIIITSNGDLLINGINNLTSMILHDLERRK